MDARLIIHYKDGSTYKSDWNEELDFSIYCEKPMTSVQLQTRGGELHTLSAKKGQTSHFWYKKGNIYKRIAKDTWVNLNLKNEKPKVNVIKDKIK